LYLLGIFYYGGFSTPLHDIRLLGVLQRKMSEFFRGYDVIAAASQNVVATKLSANLEKDIPSADPLGAIGNLCGLPAISVPCGFDSSGLPVGLQFLAPPLGEHAVVAAAELFQRHTEWHRKRPPAAH
jgi:aspartyl-tRNA(Asn)/glutamyl-tRNA(Gln) amidotransferase subunit A